MCTFWFFEGLVRRVLVCWGSRLQSFRLLRVSFEEFSFVEGLVRRNFVCWGSRLQRFSFFYCFSSRKKLIFEDLIYPAIQVHFILINICFLFKIIHKMDITCRQFCLITACFILRGLLLDAIRLCKGRSVVTHEINGLLQQ